MLPGSASVVVVLLSERTGTESPSSLIIWAPLPSTMFKMCCSSAVLLPVVPERPGYDKLEPLCPKFVWFLRYWKRPLLMNLDVDDRGFVVVGHLGAVVVLLVGGRVLL